MTDPETDKPLLPKTAVGAAVIGIPIASLIAAFGWGGEKLLSLDEAVVQMQQSQIIRKEWVVQADANIDQLAKEIRTLAEQSRLQAEEQNEIRQLGVAIDERLVRIETLVEVVKSEQDDRKNYFRKQQHMLNNGTLRETGFKLAPWAVGDTDD